MGTAVLSNQIMAMQSMLNPLPLPSLFITILLKLFININLCYTHVVAMTSHSEGCIDGHLLPQVLHQIIGG